MLSRVMKTNSIKHHQQNGASPGAVSSICSSFLNVGVGRVLQLLPEERGDPPLAAIGTTVRVKITVVIANMITPVIQPRRTPAGR